VAEQPPSNAADVGSTPASPASHRHHHAVRRARGGHRKDHPDLPAPGTATRSSCASSNRSPRPYPRAPLHLACDNYATHKHPAVKAWLARHPWVTGSPCIHPDVGILAQPGRDLLRDHHPTGHPPRHLRLGPRTHRSHHPVHRRLERTLRTVRLDPRTPTPSSPKRTVNQLPARDTRK
jgi:hypothetical protein